MSNEYFCYINGISILWRSNNMVNMSGSPGFWGSMVQVMLYYELSMIHLPRYPGYIGDLTYLLLLWIAYPSSCLWISGVNSHNTIRVTAGW